MIERVWRGSDELKDIRKKLQHAVSVQEVLSAITTNVILQPGVAQDLLEVIDQAIHTEEGHGS